MRIAIFFKHSRKGLVYLHVPIEDNDCLSVPPLEGFVMNRVLGDYLENLMYKIFVSIDEHTCATEVRCFLCLLKLIVNNTHKTKKKFYN